MPEYALQLWLFIKNPKVHTSILTEPESEHDYSPWSAFINGSAIFISILSIEAYNSVHFFDKVVTFAIVLIEGVIFILAFHFSAKFLGGKASTSQALCAGEYLLGFLLSFISLIDFLVASLINAFSRIQLSLGYFYIEYKRLPGTRNIILITIAETVLVLGIVYSIYRCFIFFKDIQKLNYWRTFVAITIGIFIVFIFRNQIEFLSKIFAGKLHEISTIFSDQ